MEAIGVGGAARYGQRRWRTRRRQARRGRAGAACPGCLVSESDGEHAHGAIFTTRPAFRREVQTVRQARAERGLAEEGVLRGAASRPPSFPFPPSPMRYGGDSLGAALQQLRRDAAATGLTILASLSHADSACAVRPSRSSTARSAPRRAFLPDLGALSLCSQDGVDERFPSGVTRSYASLGRSCKLTAPGTLSPPSLATTISSAFSPTSPDLATRSTGSASSLSIAALPLTLSALCRTSLARPSHSSVYTSAIATALLLGPTRSVRTVRLL